MSMVKDLVAGESENRGTHVIANGPVYNPPIVFPNSTQPKCLSPG